MKKLQMLVVVLAFVASGQNLIAGRTYKYPYTDNLRVAKIKAKSVYNGTDYKEERSRNVSLESLDKKRGSRTVPSKKRIENQIKNLNLKIVKRFYE